MSQFFRGHYELIGGYFMKIYNHKRVLAMLYTQTPQITKDPQDHGITEKQIHDACEILLDCGCQTCWKFIPGLQMALTFIGMNDIKAASTSLSLTLQEIGMLNIPQNYSLQ